MEERAANQCHQGHRHQGHRLWGATVNWLTGYCNRGRNLILDFRAGYADMEYKLR